MSLEQLEQKLRTSLEKLPLLRKIESELRDGYDLSVSASLAVSVSNESGVTAVKLSELTEDSFAEYRVPSFRLEIGDKTFLDPAKAAEHLNERLGDETSRFQVTKLTVRGESFEIGLYDTIARPHHFLATEREKIKALRDICGGLSNGGTVEFAILKPHDWNKVKL